MPGSRRRLAFFWGGVYRSRADIRRHLRGRQRQFGVGSFLSLPSGSDAVLGTYPPATSPGEPPHGAGQMGRGRIARSEPSQKRLRAVPGVERGHRWVDTTILSAPRGSKNALCGRGACSITCCGRGAALTCTCFRSSLKRGAWGVHNDCEGRPHLYLWLRALVWRAGVVSRHRRCGRACASSAHAFAVLEKENHPVPGRLVWVFGRHYRVLRLLWTVVSSWDDFMPVKRAAWTVCSR